jgi:hypothetical protein
MSDVAMSAEGSKKDLVSSIKSSKVKNKVAQKTEATIKPTSSETAKKRRPL